MELINDGYIEQTAFEKAVVPMWQYANLNTMGKSVWDCTVRAISIATGSAWVDTYLDLCLTGMVMVAMQSATVWEDTAVMMAICAAMDVVCVTVIAGTMAKLT